MNQPAMGAWAIKKLGEALHDIIGAEATELEGSTYFNDPDWFEKGKLANKVEKWREIGLGEIDEAVKTFNETLNAEYVNCMIQVCRVVVTSTITSL